MFRLKMEREYTENSFPEKCLQKCVVINSW